MYMMKNSLKNFLIAMKIIFWSEQRPQLRSTIRSWRDFTVYLKPFYMMNYYRFIIVFTSNTFHIPIEIFNIPYHWIHNAHSAPCTTINEWIGWLPNCRYTGIIQYKFIQLKIMKCLFDDIWVHSFWISWTFCPIFSLFGFRVTSDDAFIKLEFSGGKAFESTNETK